MNCETQTIMKSKLGFVEMVWTHIEPDMSTSIFLYSRWHLIYYDYSCIFGKNITKAGFQWKPRIFFLFCDLVFIDIFDGFSGIHGYFRRIKLKTLGGIHKTWKKNETSEAPRWARGPPLRPPLRASRSAPALGPSGVPQRFQFIFLSGFMKPPKVSILSCEKYPWNHWNHQKYQWNQVTKKKCVVSI